MSKAGKHWDDRLSRRLRLRDLRYLIAISELGSMAKAAASLGVSQPAVSKAVGDLEDALGACLLERSPRGVEPTIYGQALIRRGLAVFDELKLGIGEIEYLADPTAGEVRIGCGEAGAAGYLAPVVERFTRQNPRVVLHVVQSIGATLDYRELRERKLDLMIGRIPIPFAEDALNAEILFNENLLVVAGLKSTWARRRKVELADLVDAPWVETPSDSQISKLVAQAFNAHGLDAPKARVITFSMHLRNYLLTNADFVTSLPSSMVRFANHLSLKALPVDLAIEPRPIAVITLRGRILSPVALRFIECARTVTKPMAARQAIRHA